MDNTSQNINPDRLPVHIAIIADGNRRWARSKGLMDFEGHKHGFETMQQLSKDARKLGIKYVTFWFFSTENWKRAKDEVDYLMNLALVRVDKMSKDLIEEGVRFTHLGRKDRIPKKLAKKFSELEEKTKHFVGYYLNIAFDYGGRDELVTAIKEIIKSGVKAEDVTEELIPQYLYTGKYIPDPDLIIRTSGEQRLSGYLTWQGIYSELYFPLVHCPDFNIDELRKAIAWYQERDRKYGGNSVVEDSKFKKVSVS